MESIKNEVIESNGNKVMYEFARRLNVTPKQIMEPDKSSYISDIRYLYCKLRYEKHGITYSEAGREIGRTPATVLYGVRRINDLICWEDEKILEMWNTVRDISGLYL